MPRLQTSRYSAGTKYFMALHPSVWQNHDKGLSEAAVTQAEAPVPVVITAYSDKTFTYVSPPPMPALSDVTSTATTFTATL